MSDRKYRTFPITVAGQTRDIACSSWEAEPHRYDTGEILVGHIGRGAKTHRCAAYVWRFEDEAAARRAGYPTSAIVGRDEDGAVWCFQGLGHALNRQVRVTGWYDAPEDATSRHIME